MTEVSADPLRAVERFFLVDYNFLSKTKACKNTKRKLSDVAINACEYRSPKKPNKLLASFVFNIFLFTVL